MSPLSLALITSAAGIVAEDTDCTLAVALVKIEIRSRVTGLSLLEAADDVIERRSRYS